MISTDADDARWLSVAQAQADKIQGHTAENPSVGCAIISQEGQLVGVGHTSFSGRPHAERNALIMAGDKAKDGTAFVTLEPCSHHGKTGPCCDALISAGLSRVVIGLSDPNPKVDGAGIEKLRQAGVSVTVIGSSLANHQMAGFLSAQQRNRPFVSVKMATSLDGYITAQEQTQTWLTGDVSRQFVHNMRSRCNVLLTTFQTIRIDEPQFNVRINGYNLPQPPLAIIDRHGQLNPEHKCLSINRPVYHYHAISVKPHNLPKNVTSIGIESEANGLILRDILSDLQARGLYQIMVEAGAGLFEGLDKENLIDELVWLRAPHELGGGLLAWHSHCDMAFSSPAHYMKHKSFQSGDDQASIFVPDKR